MAVENARIAQLDNLPTEQIADGDLLIVSDISAGLTKHSTASSYKTYVLNGVYSGSINVPSSSISTTSSFANQANNSVSASVSTSSSLAQQSISSSYSVTASFALNANVSAGTTITTGSFYPISSSRSITGSNADTASHALNLVYNGTPNGTSSFSISSSFATTASAVTVGGYVNMTSSHAGVSEQSYTSSYLYYDGVNLNGTASHAVDSAFAGTADVASLAVRVPNVFVFYGPWTSSVDDNLNYSHSFLRDTASFTPEAGDDSTVGWFYCRGQVTSSFTSSTSLWTEPRYVYLVIQNQLTGTETVLDRQDFTFNVFNAGPGSEVISGSFVSAFELAGYSSSLSESYSVYVSASKGVHFDFNRPPVFTFQTKAANFNVYGNDY